MKKANKGRIGLIIALAATMSCGSAVAISQLCLSENGGVISAYAETVSDASAQTYTAEEIASLWSSAVQESIDTGERVTFTLPCDWTAQPDETYTTSFGEGTGFNNGEIRVPSYADILLDLNGYTIDRGLSSAVEIEFGDVITVINSKLEITDSSESGSGMITGGNDETYGGGIIVTRGGDLVISGGKISGNKTTQQGGGIFVRTESTVTINGGEISNNEASTEGGGIYIDADASCVMNDGVISGNTATDDVGGGVYNDGTFTMNGGTISGNTSDVAGGVCTGGTFNMNGGVITGNATTSDGGGLVNETGTFNLTGGKIFGNHSGENVEDDVVIADVINVTGKLAPDTYIKINTVWWDGVFTSGYKAKGNSLSKAPLHFAGDGNDYTVSDNGSEATLVHVSTPVTKTNVDWKYSVYDSSFNKTGEVTVDDGVFSATAVYNGGSFTFDAIAQGIAVATDANGKTVSRFSNVGKYYLNVKPQNAANYENPFFTFEILPANIADEAVTIKADSVVYTGEELSTSVKVSLNGVLLEENKDYTVSYKDNVNAGEGTVIITAKGNYTGTVEGTFTIEKAKIGVRWGLTSLTYNGEAQGLEVYPEGLKGDDEVNLVVTYFDETGSTEVVPKEKGKYIAKVSLTDDNYKLAISYETYFTIGSKKVDVVWSDTEFVYTGETHEITAHFVDSEGNEVPLTVTAGDLTNAGKGTATAALPATGYEDYVLTDNTVSVSYVIAQAEVTAVWPETYNFKYDGNAKEVEVTLAGLNGVDLSADVSYTYYDKDGNELTDLPVDAGDYKVVISYTNDNYKLVGKTEDTFTVAKANLKVTLDDNFDGEYSGEAKTPLISVTDEYDDDIDYTVSYAPADQNGNATGEYGAEVPVNVGKYILKIELNADNVAQSEYTATFEITAKKVLVVWNFGDTAVEINNVYTYLYNGKAQAPKAYFTDVNGEQVALTVTGTGKGVGNGYSSSVTLSDTNYVLDGVNSDLQVTFNIIKSKVTGVLWYEYGKDVPVADGEKLSYEYISVYGQEGAKLSAYGILVPADGSVTWNAADSAQIALNVSYAKYSSGYWTELGTYTANATLSSADKVDDACYMPLGINDEIEFEVTGITHGASVAQIKWIIVTENGKHVEIDGNYKFIYNGELQAPIAIRITSSAYDPDFPEADTFEILNVGGAQKNAGTYYAYIVTEDFPYDFENEDDAEFKFTIAPKEILIAWEGANSDGEVEVTYNGKAQAPKAFIADASGNAVLDDNGDTQYLEVEGFVDAGTYTAVAKTDGNVTITGDGSVKFVIKQHELNTNDIVWEFVTGDEGDRRTDTDGKEYFVWQYDGNAHVPTAKLEVVLVENEDPVEITLTLTGSATASGVHYAYATLDSSDYANANFVMKVARLKLEIVQDTVTVAWEGANADGELIYTYDGTVHEPKAYIVDAGGNPVLDGAGNYTYLNVVGSGTDAGKYVALITDDIDISNGKTKIFTIKEKQVTADWEKTELVYNGDLRAPTVTFYDTVTADNGDRIEITLQPGADYTVKGYVNAGSYVSEVTLLNGNYKFADGTNLHDFVITKRTVTLDWYGVGGYDEATGVGDTTDFGWEYDGNAHAPTVKAIDGLEIVIKGAEKNVGSYKAVAVIDNDNYAISNAEKEFSIKGSEITVMWVGNVTENDDGSTTETFSWEFDVNGKAQGPKAYIQLADGSQGGELKVLNYGIYAGDYTAYAVLPANCKWSDADTNKCEFKITPRIIQGIVWKGVNGSETDFDWEYDGERHVPTAEMERDGTPITVTGAAINKGTYKATAVLADNKNYAFADDVDTEIEFTVHARTVNVTWKGEGGSLNDFSWAYDGDVHAPTAWFTDVNGTEVEIPVIGGTATGGQHVAKLMDVFDNYDFVEAKRECAFSITEMTVDVEWSTDDAQIVYDENDASVISSVMYTYEYNGGAQMPAITVKDSDGAVLAQFNLNYLIKDKADGSAVSAIINAGTYEVTVTPADKNYKISGLNTVTVIVKAKEVAVEWENTALTYNGENQKPNAYYTDVAGNRIELSVSGAQTEVGDSYTATATLESDNYVLTGDVTKTFSIVKSTATEYKWVWDENGVGSWVEVTDGTGSGETGDGGETTDPTTPTDPVTPPESGDGTGDNTGDNTQTGDGNEGDGNEGNIPTEPETPNPDPAEGDNPATDPNDGNKDEAEEDSEGGNGNG